MFASVRYTELQKSSVQMDKEEYDLLFNFVHGSKFPDSLSKNKKDALRRKR